MELNKQKPKGTIRDYFSPLTEEKLRKNEPSLENPKRKTLVEGKRSLGNGFRDEDEKLEIKQLKEGFGAKIKIHLKKLSDFSEIERNIKTILVNSSSKKLDTNSTSEISDGRSGIRAPSRRKRGFETKDGKGTRSKKFKRTESERKNETGNGGRRTEKSLRVNVKNVMINDETDASRSILINMEEVGDKIKTENKSEALNKEESKAKLNKGEKEVEDSDRTESPKESEAAQSNKGKASKDKTMVNGDKNIHTNDKKTDLGESKDKTEEDDEDEVYEVEKILDYAWCSLKKRGLYLVKWAGWEDKFNTWEPYSNLHCDEKLKDFYYQRLQERETATPSVKKSLEVPPDPRTNFEKRSQFLDTFFSPPCFSELDAFYQSLKTKATGGTTVISFTKKIKEWSDVYLEATIDQLSTQKKPSEKKLEIVKEQLMYKHLRDTRKSQQIRLKEWEEEINKMENVKIVVCNEADLDGPPRHMTYINEYKPFEGILLPDDPPLGCECESCELRKEKKCCPGNYGTMFPYNKYGKLRVDIGTPIFECNKACKCGPDCTNRVVQKGRKFKLCIYRTDNGCGWGVKTLENIRRGSFIVEYVGEVITSEQAEERGKKYDAEGRTYLFDLDFNMGDECPYTVDAANYGNVSHFINHSCDPNLAIFNVWINCLDPNLPRLCLFAKRDIIKGEQLTFDYCQRTAQEEEQEKNKLNPSSQTATRMECKCGTKVCRKWLFER